MKKIFFLVGIILTVIGLIFGAEKEIEWTAYLGFPLFIFFGGVGFAFFTKRIEGIIAGMFLAALWPFVWEALKTAFVSIL